MFRWIRSIGLHAVGQTVTPPILSRRLRSATMLALASLACGHDSARIESVERMVIESVTVLSSGEDALWGVRDVMETENMYWVLTGSVPFLHGFSPQGDRVVTFGSLGEGPGELSSPRALWVGDSVGTVTVWDMGTSQAETFSESGRHISSQPMPKFGVIRRDISTLTHGNPYRVFRQTNTTVFVHYASGVSSASDLWLGKLGGAVVGGTGTPNVIMDFASDLEGASQFVGRTGFLVPVPLWDGCPDGRIAVLDSVRRVLILVDTEGESRDSIALTWRPHDLRPSERHSYIRFQMANELRNEGMAETDIDQLAEAALAASQELFPRDAPFAVDLKCAPDLVWIQDFDGSAHPLGYGPLWHAVAQGDGVPRFAAVRFPAGFSPFRISTSQALGVVTDRNSVQRLAVVHLP